MRCVGSILYLRIFGQQIIILDSLEDATELLERRSKSYSSRPIVPMYDLYVISYSSISHLSPLTLTVEWGLFRQVLACVFTGKNGGNSAGYSSKPSSLIHPWNTGRFKLRRCMICYMDFYKRKTISNPMFTRENVPQIFMVKLTPLNKLRCCNYPLRHLWLQRSTERRSVCQASGVYVGSICICGVPQVECQ